MIIRDVHALKNSNTHQYREKVAKLKNRSFTVGIHSKDNKPYPNRKDITTAMVGRFHEFGTSKMPARIWLRIFTLLNAEKKKFSDKIKKMFIKEKNVDKILSEAGSFQKSEIVNRIKKDGVTPSSYNRTGITLVDTGQLVDSIDYEVH